MGLTAAPAVRLVARAWPKRSVGRRGCAARWNRSGSRPVRFLPFRTDEGNCVAEQAIPAGEDLSVPMDYVPGARGYAILAAGRDGDGDGAEAIAIWRLGATGHAVGAWIFRLDELDELEADRERLLNVLSLLQDRCLVDWDADRPDAVLRRIEPWLPVDLVSVLRSNMLFIPDLLEEIREHRRICAEAVERHRPHTNSKLVPLAWSIELPDDQEQARRLLTPSPQPAAAPVAAEALALAGSVRRAVELWQDTEQTRYRRAYLRSLGEAQPLPPRWLATLRTAGAGVAAVAVA